MISLLIHSDLTESRFGPTTWAETALEQYRQVKIYTLVLFMKFPFVKVNRKENINNEGNSLYFAPGEIFLAPLMFTTYCFVINYKHKEQNKTI